MGFSTVRCIPFPVAFSGILLALLVQIASGSTLFLVGSLGHWVLGQSCGPKSISLGIVGLFVWRILSDVAGILWKGDSFPVWELLHLVLWLSVASHALLLSIMTRRWIYGHLGF